MQRPSRKFPKECPLNIIIRVPVATLVKYLYLAHWFLLNSLPSARYAFHVFSHTRTKLSSKCKNHQHLQFLSAIAFFWVCMYIKIEFLWVSVCKNLFFFAIFGLFLCVSTVFLDKNDLLCYVRIQNRGIFFVLYLVFFLGKEGFKGLWFVLPLLAVVISCDHTSSWCVFHNWSWHF